MTTQPTYWDACTRMDFAALRKFIDDALADASSPPEYGYPNSKAEFVTLWEMLLSKTEGRGLPQIPVNPNVAIPNLPRYVASKKLKVLKQDFSYKLSSARRARLSEESIESLRHELWPAIQLQENLEKTEYKKHRAEVFRKYYAAVQPYQTAIQPWNRAIFRSPNPARLKIVKRVWKDIGHAFQFNDVLARRLSWRILPKGQLSVETLLTHYSNLQTQDPVVKYDTDRIKNAFSLQPSECYVGTDEFTGYIVLKFSYTTKVLLECPIFGNAIYILNSSDWKALSKMTKHALLQVVSNDVMRVVHSGDWFGRVRKELDVR